MLKYYASMQLLLEVSSMDPKVMIMLTDSVWFSCTKCVLCLYKIDDDSYIILCSREVTLILKKFEMYRNTFSTSKHRLSTIYNFLTY